MDWLKKLLGRDKPAATVTATLRKELGNLYVLRIGGLVNKATVDNIQAVARRDIEAGAKGLKVMLILQDFRGWKRGDDWGDLEFFAKYEQQIAKLAVVGESRWKDETLLFLGAGRRTGEVRYFSDGQEAAGRAWLAGGAST